jgi:CDP-diacylglycerol--glycerol-3-phosphate 3-phosphatidyltransferase
LHTVKQQKIITHLPTAITFLRLAALPFLVSLITVGQVFFADLLFIFAIGSDFADGYLARKMSLSSQIGAYFDVTVDFIFSGGMFLYFILSRIYPSWVLFLITGMFLQYILTSKLLRITLDPIGKYYGSLLYCAIGLTLLFKSQPAPNMILYSLVTATIFTLSSRIVYLIKKCP